MGRNIDNELKEQLLLSLNTHSVHLPGCGHNMHLIRPDIVAEIQWVLGQLQSQSMGSPGL